MHKLVRKLLVYAAVIIGAAKALGSSRGRSPSSSPVADELIGPVRKSSLRRWAIEVAAILLILGALGFLVAASGVISIKASSGHWPITRWFLEFSMERSISLHSHGVKVPSDLNDPAMILRGAGHYETACRSCHGSPSLQHPKIAAEMTPEPPYLPRELPNWQPEELFYIVKHGIKLTGMPAWPARERDDEIWSMVAFLLDYPKDAAEYDALVFGNTVEKTSDAPLTLLDGPEAVPEEIGRSCARCHGVDGNGRGNAAFPKLASQKSTYIFNALRAYARGERHSGIMKPVAAGLDETTMKELALYYASRPQRSHRHETDHASIERGRQIAHHGIQSQKIPSCADCHGPGATPTKDAYPRLSGQYASYLVQQLELFASQHRGGSPYAHLMHPIAPKLSEQQQQDVAAFYESLSR